MQVDQNLEPTATSLDIGLVLKLQHKLSEVEREKSKLVKRLDELESSPKAEKADNSIRDSLKISELELANSNLKNQLYEMTTSIKDGSSNKVQEQLKMLHEELDRKSEEIVQLKSVLATQADNMKAFVCSKARAGWYI